MDALRQTVCNANRQLAKTGLALLTWGNASQVDRKAGVVAIKPSGIAYDQLESHHIVLVDLATGELRDSGLKPSSDTATHLELYRAFPSIGAVVHTHSTYATAWAQAGRTIPCLGTTHADTFFGAIPVTRALNSEEIRGEYEMNTGRLIVAHFRQLEIEPDDMPGVLVAGHGPFVWGATANGAVEHAQILEEVSRLAWVTMTLESQAGPIAKDLLNRHFLRKHGANAYYGQSTDFHGH